MNQGKGCRLKKCGAFILMLLMAGMLVSCKGKEETEGDTALLIPSIPQKEETSDAGQEAGALKPEEAGAEETDAEKTKAEETKPESEVKGDERTDSLQKEFGENCIADQTYEVELSQYSGKVYFVPFAPAENGKAFSIQIIQNGEVLTQIDPYVPEGIPQDGFTGLDAAAFYDVNYDGNTDIVLIETYGNKSFAAVYYGFDGYSSRDYERQFMAKEQLSRAITEGVDTLTVPEIRNFLSEGKKNGEFSGYGEAYKAVSRLYELEREGTMEYNLIYVDEDTVPELAAGLSGYYVSLYTYHDGTVYTLMDEWAYGAMGNAGYEYSPKKNSLRNYNTDYAGAILYTTYMTIGSSYSIDTEASLVTYNFDDVNGNGMPDEEEMDSLGVYGAVYMNGEQIAADEEIPYDAGEYEYIDVTMDRAELEAELKGK